MHRPRFLYEAYARRSTSVLGATSNLAAIHLPPQSYAWFDACGGEIAMNDAAANKAMTSEWALAWQQSSQLEAYTLSPLLAEEVWRVIA